MTAALLVVARYTFVEDVTPGDLADLRALAAATMTEPGNLGYELLRPDGDDRQVVLLETYIDEDSLLAHRASGHFRELAVERVFPRLESRVVRVGTLEV